MSSHRIFAFTLLALTLAAAPFCVGCFGRPGDRAREGCPDGEVCSSVTPGGLTFSGSGVGGVFLDFGSTIYATAVGGRQTISFRPAVSGESLPPISMVTTDPTILEIESSATRSATLYAGRAGTTHLRILDATDDTLVDRLLLAARPIDHVRLDALDLVTALAPDPAPIGSFPGEAELYVHLVDAGGAFLVDDGMALGLGTTAYTTGSGDQIMVTLPASGWGVDVEAAGSSFHAEATVVTAIDDIVVADWMLSSDSMGAYVDAGGLFCVVPMAGATRVIGQSGAVFTVDGVAASVDPSQPSCATLPDVLAGATTSIEVTIYGVTRTFSMRVGASMASALSAPLDLSFVPRPRWAFGERASVSPF